MTFTRNPRYPVEKHLRVAASCNTGERGTARKIIRLRASIKHRRGTHSGGPALDPPWVPLESTWIARSLFLNNPRMGHLKGVLISLEPRVWSTKLRERSPVMGSRFNSRARSFEASCHSLVMDFGGGPPGATVSIIGKKTCRKWSGPTECSARKEQCTAGEDSGHDGQYQLWYAAGRVEISSGSMRSKSDVVGCIYVDVESANDYSRTRVETVRGREKPDARTGFFLV